MASLRLPLILLLLLVGSTCAAKFRLGDPSFMSQSSELAATSSSNCTTCTNGAACCDGEQCCSGGKDCCPLNSTCCGDGCCGETQSCCPDPKYGDVCCQAEVTFCCPPDNNPSRCCPRWMICCPVGRYGCCDPTSGLPVDDLALYRAPPRSALPSGTAAALYVNIGGTFSAMTIDMATGKRTDVPLPGFNDWSEITRTFAYDATHSVFYLLQANFLANSTDHAITLWTVDPVAGTVTNITVSGADDEGTQDVAGFAWVAAQSAILFSVEVVSGKHSDKIDAYKFYTLSPTTGVATLVSTYTTPSGSATPDYVGWFDGVAANGTTLYRLGYQDPTTSTNPGLAITDISTPTATTTWVDNVPVPPKLQWYTSLTVSGSAFISLTPDDTGKYSLVKWDLSGSASVVMSLPNAHRTPYFGSLAEAYDGVSSTYAALVVYEALVSDLDRWDLVVLNVATGKVAELALSPVLLAKFTSVSGLGF